MKKFSFRLQTVLEIRENKLDAKRKEMAEYVKRLNEQIDILESLQNRQVDIKQKLDFIYSQDKALDVVELTNYKNFLSKLMIEEKKQQMVVEQFRNFLAIKQREVAEALKEVKVMEKLKSNQEKNFYTKLNFLEAKEIDDIASTRYKRIAV